MSDFLGIARDPNSIPVMSLICNGIGVLGFMIYMTNYTMVTFQRIDSRGLLFFSLNTMAATFVLISLTQNFNLASAMIQIVWICLGTIAIKKRWSLRSAASLNPQLDRAFGAVQRENGAI